MLAKEKLEEAMKGANDLNSLVRKKQKPDTAASAGAAGEKRKLSDIEEAESTTDKKTKVEDA